jgi:MerR family transcriptional regulator, thiopeptide resistance regulator
VPGWSTAEVARASGVPVPVLRAWARAGLVLPGIADDDGYRAYGRDDLVRLQRVLLLRGLGLPHDDVAAALDGEEADDETALRGHLDVLDGVRERLDRQAAALRATLAGADDPATMLDGFTEPGPGAVAGEDLAELAVAWARTWAAGEPVDGAAAQELAGRQRALTGSELTPRLAEAFDHHAPGTAAYARDALAVG